MTAQKQLREDSQQTETCHQQHPALARRRVSDPDPQLKAGETRRVNELDPQPAPYTLQC